MRSVANFSNGSVEVERGWARASREPKRPNSRRMLLAMLDLRGEENVRIVEITLTKARSQPRTTSVAGLLAVE
jgi:hypothetical protein